LDHGNTRSSDARNGSIGKAASCGGAPIISRCGLASGGAVAKISHVAAGRSGKPVGEL